LAKNVDWEYNVGGALSLYFGLTQYNFVMLKVGKLRINLEGEPDGKVTKKQVLHHRINLIKRQRFSYCEGYQQCLNDMIKLMGRYATGKNFTQSSDSAKTHLVRLSNWAKNVSKGVPSLFDEDSLTKRLEVLHKAEAKEPKPVPKRPILKLKVKSNRVLVKRKAA